MIIDPEASCPQVSVDANADESEVGECKKQVERRRRKPVRIRQTHKASRGLIQVLAAAAFIDQPADPGGSQGALQQFVRIADLFAAESVDITEVVGGDADHTVAGWDGCQDRRVPGLHDLGTSCCKDIPDKERDHRAVRSGLGVLHTHVDVAFFTVSDRKVSDIGKQFDCRGRPCACSYEQHAAVLGPFADDTEISALHLPAVEIGHDDHIHLLHARRRIRKIGRIQFHDPRPQLRTRHAEPPEVGEPVRMVRKDTDQKLRTASLHVDGSLQLVFQYTVLIQQA